jgi:hypothetical protein
MDLRLDTTVDDEDKEGEPGDKVPEDVVEAAEDEGPAVKSRSSLLDNSTDQFTSKTAER